MKNYHCLILAIIWFIIYLFERLNHQIIISQIFVAAQLIIYKIKELK